MVLDAFSRLGWDTFVSRFFGSSDLLAGKQFQFLGTGLVLTVLNLLGVPWSLATNTVIQHPASSSLYWSKLFV